MEMKVWYLISISTGEKPSFLTMNWSAETKSPTSYLYHNIIAYFFGISACLITLRLWFIARTWWKEAHFETGKSGVDFNLGKMKGGITILTPSFSIDLFYFIVTWILYIIVPSFQCESISSFCGPYKFSISSDPTHGQQIFE